MLTSKGIIQGYNGVAAVDKKHQVIVDAQAFGEGQEHHTLQPILASLSDTFKKQGIHEYILGSQVIVTADTGFSNDRNNQFLKENNINAYIPDNAFRSRDPKFKHQKKKYGKRHQKDVVGVKQVIPNSEFKLNATTKTCVCPAGEKMWLRSEVNASNGQQKLFFEGRMSKCRICPLKDACLRNPESPNDRKGHGRQVSFTLGQKKTATDWMKKRVDSKVGKQIYSHRMSVVEPVFGNIGTNKGLNRFSLRGKEKVQGQWRMFCMIHNIEKLANYSEFGQYGA